MSDPTKSLASSRFRGDPDMSELASSSSGTACLRVRLTSASEEVA